MKGNKMQDISFIKQCIKNPVKMYKELKFKIRDQSGGICPNASMQHAFATLVDDLHSMLHDAFVVEFCGLPEQKALNIHRKAMILMVQSLRVKYHDTTVGTLDDHGFSYPHKILTDGPYNYLAVLNMVVNVITFFDTLERATKMVEVTNLDQKKEIHPLPDLYHTNRYLHYLVNQYFNEDYIMIPTTQKFSFRDLIRLRAAPIAMCGVSHETKFIDGYANSPLDFYLHDFNHNRRFNSYNRQYFDKYCKDHCLKREELTDETKFKIYEEFHSFLEQKVLKPTQTLPELNLSKEEEYIRRVMTVLYFQLFFEYAFTPDKDSITRAFKFKPGSKAPFEIMTIDDNNAEAFSMEHEVNNRRMDNNNIDSGFTSKYGNAKLRQTININYIFDGGPNFISNTYHQLITQYFDNKSRPIRDLPPYEARTPELVAKAARRIMQDLDLRELLNDPDFSEENLVLLAKNETCKEKYPNHQLKVILSDEVKIAMKRSKINAGTTLLFNDFNKNKIVTTKEAANNDEKKSHTLPKAKL